MSIVHCAACFGFAQQAAFKPSGASPAKAKPKRATTSQAEAHGSSIIRQFSIGVLGGYGFKDGYLAGFGARAGVTFGQFIYLGGMAMAHTGKKVDNVSVSSVGMAAGQVNINSNSVYYGVEAGIEPTTRLRLSAIIGAVTLRGEAVASSGATLSPTGTTFVMRFVFAPGVTYTLPVLGLLNVGADVRYIIVGQDDSFTTNNINNPSGSVFAAYLTVGFYL
jgi:hypothetical protein